MFYSWKTDYASFSAGASGNTTFGAIVIRNDFPLPLAGLHRMSHSMVVSALQKAAALLKEMTPAEKAQLLQWTALDLGDAFPGIESRPEIAGREPCIIRTRIPVWVLEQARRQGAKEIDLLNAYPTLRPQDLANAWSYVQAHSNDIEQEIAQNEAA